MTERNEQLEAALRQHDPRITELKRMVAGLTRTVEVWKRDHRMRPGGKIAQKPRDPRKASGRGPGHLEGSTRSAPASADSDVVVPMP